MRELPKEKRKKSKHKEKLGCERDPSQNLNF